MNEDLISYWDAEAERFDEAADHGLGSPTVYAAWRQLLARAIGTVPARVADLGCGTGTLSLLLADLGHRVDGLDFSAAMLDRARAKVSGHVGLSFRVGDASNPPLPRGVFDVVLSRHVLWALPEPAKALQQWEGLLVPGGALIIIDGRWQTGAGLSATTVLDLLRALGRDAELTRLRDPALWGRAITDERYLVVSR